MAIGKEIIVLSGGGHKGVVKISSVAGKENTARVNCSLDFRPSGTTLYLIGDNIAEIALKDINCTSEVSFRASDGIGCVVRSSSLTMFGGKGAKSLMLKKIDDYNRFEKPKKTDATANAANKQTEINGKKTADDGEIMSRVTDVNSECDGDIICGAQSATTVETQANGSDARGENIAAEAAEADINTDKNSGRREPRVEAKASSVNPLGDWTKYDGNNFYYAVKPQIDEMFVCYPEEKLLSQSVPNSKWVRVDAEDGYYVVGLLFDEDEPSFICYGVPQVRLGENVSKRAPAELENMCVWLPLGEGGEIEGYWMIYQSARTGEIIK